MIFVLGQKKSGIFGLNKNRLSSGDRQSQKQVTKWVIQRYPCQISGVHICVNIQLIILICYMINCTKVFNDATSWCLSVHALLKRTCKQKDVFMVKCICPSNVKHIWFQAKSYPYHILKFHVWNLYVTEFPLPLWTKMVHPSTRQWFFLFDADLR